MAGSLYTQSVDALRGIWDDKFADQADLGWGPRMRLRFGYYTPDDHYEATLERLIAPGNSWADIGCGRDIFPQNPRLARRLAERCAHVLGIDPDDNIRDNPLVSEAFQGLVQDFRTAHRYDLVTLRMVAEHITDPGPAARSIHALLKPGGHVVIFTPHKWAPVSVIAKLTPHRLHQPVKRLLWATEARDTFPVAYQLNTRKDIRRHLGAAGLAEQHFQLLDDCRIFNQFRLLNFLELSVCKALNAVGLKHPECCILAVYRKPI